VGRLFSNPALLIGLTGTLVLLLMGIFGTLLAPYDPSANQSSIIRVLPDGTSSIQFPPTLPDAQHWLGTDPLGRDQWSRVLAGAWLSLSVVVASALFRLGIGFSLGLASGWYGGPFARVVRVIAVGLGTIPQLLLAIMLVLVTRPLGVAGFIASLAVVGWPEISEFVRTETLRAKAAPFIEAARSVGAPGRRLITTHLFATVGPQLLTVAALETGAVLLLLAELGLIGLFLAGATFLVGDFGRVGPLRSRVPEWGQMLGGIQFYAITAELPTLIPAVFVVLASAIFALLADGLRAASDPFSARRVMPGTFGVLTKVLVGALCFSAVGFVGVNLRPGVMSMDEGRSVAAKTAETTWPGSEFVAGVARFSPAAFGIDRPERLTYYYRNANEEVLRISFMNGDRLAIETRKYESEDEIDFTGLKALPAGLMSYDDPLAKAEEQGGFDRRHVRPADLVRVILTWPGDREAPVYSVIYGSTQLDPLRVCCFDARTGETVDAVVGQRTSPPWPVPSDCAAARSVIRQVGPFQWYFVQGALLSVGGPFNLNYQGDNFIQLIGGQGTPRLEAATNHDDTAARADVVNAKPTTTVGGQAVSLATLRLSKPGCWNLRISVGNAALEYTLYAYPSDCRPQHEQFPPIPDVTPLPCVRTQTAPMGNA
jgi:peptide/nickel transport system permease protein